MTDPRPGETSDPQRGHDRTDGPRSDLQQEVEARSDAVDRGEGGDGRSPLDPPGVYDGNAGTGGVVKNQDVTQQ